MRERLLKEESGFTLPEVLVTMVMMVTVMFALYAIFDMSLRVFSFGNDKLEAVENARTGLTKMEREIRAAYPYDKPTNNTRLSTWDEKQITFGNDVETINRQIEPDEEISYYLNSDDKLIRSEGGTASSVIAIPLPSDGLEFEYFKEDGTTEVPIGGDESKIEIVHIKLTVEVDGRTQTLNSDVALRNEGG